jgi:hypothetical protein
MEEKMHDDDEETSSPKTKRQRRDDTSNIENSDKPVEELSSSVGTEPTSSVPDAATEEGIEQDANATEQDTKPHNAKFTFEEEVDFLFNRPPEMTNSAVTISESDYVFPSKNSNPKENKLVYSTALPSKPDYNIRWIERVASYYIPSASFTFEVQYPNPKILPLGFTYQWQYLPYSVSSPKCILICVVKTVTDAFSSAIAVGDIVLKFNDEVIVYKPGDSVPEEKLNTYFDDSFPVGRDPSSTSSSSSSSSFTPSASIRFLRPGSTCNNAIPSVAEILLLTTERSSGARFNVKMMIKEGHEFFSLELIQMDNQVSLAGCVSSY